MGEVKKLCIRRFDSMRETESFYNKFSENNNILSSDLKVITREKGAPSFILVIEYVGNK